MKTGISIPILLSLMFVSFSSITYSQSLIGTWQLVKETTCLEDKMTANQDTQNLVDEMKQMSPAATASVVRFKEKGNGEESSRILTKRKAANNKNFLYKYNGETLLILDKKSQTITDSFVVDKLSSDSLIVSNASRPCETRIFLKIKEPK